MAFTAEREQRLREFWPTTEPLRVLAKEWGVSDACISTRAKRLGLPSRASRKQEIRCQSIRENFKGSIEGRKYLEAEATKRGVSPEVLRYKILDTVLNDRMIDAVLDDDLGSRAL